MSRFPSPRWPLLLVLVAGVAIVVGLAYLPSDDSGEALPPRGGSYTEGVAGAPARVNPLFAPFNDVDRDLVSLVFSGLVRLGPNGAVQPDLASLPQVTPDGASYIFELEPGLFWHDGEPVDSGDVVFTFEAIQDPDFEGDPVLADLFRDVTVEAQDERTVIVTLAEPFAPFLARGAAVGILPEHLLGELDAAALAEAPFNEHPIGSGPFRLVRLTSSEAELAPFEGYHLGRPFLQDLRLRFYRGEAELMAALRNDEIDGALLRPGVDAEDIAFIDGNDDFTRRTLHGTACTFVYLSPGVAGFAEAPVRRALQYGLDRTVLIDEVLGGQALRMDSPLVPDLWAYAGDEEAYAYDVARATAFLDTFGWELDGAVREKDGEPFQFSLAASDDPVQLAVAQEIARQWGELGIDVEVQVSGASTFVEQVLLPRSFDAALVTVDPGPDPDPYPLWHSTQALGEGGNLAGFSNEEADQLLENGRLTTSPAERADNYRAFQEIFARELPAVVLYTPAYQYVVRSAVQGLSPGLLLDTSSRFNDVHLWYRETGRSGGGG